MPIYALTYHKLAQTSYFHSAEELSTDDVAVVALDQGQVLGRVVSGPHKDLDDVEEGVLGQVVRRATPEDLAKEEENRSFGREAGVFWKACVARRSLEMKLVDVEVFLDRTKLIFYFTAQSRIDFRELVKDLVHEYRLRIEFRQIGVRHETQMIGAVGNCGMVCCCRRYLHQFAPVTIRMAKEQDLFLNPSKVSGICGRLLCCLAYEQENYEKFHNASPRPGKRYATARGHFKVVRSNMFQNSVTCLAEGGEEVRFSLEEWNAMNPVKIEGGPRDSTEHYKSPLQCYGDEYDGEFPEDDVPEHRKARPSRQKPQKQTFVTGRVSYRQQGRGQESWKRSAGLVPPLCAQSSRPEQPAGQGQRQHQLAQPAADESRARTGTRPEADAPGAAASASSQEPHLSQDAAHPASSHLSASHPSSRQPRQRQQPRPRQARPQEKWEKWGGALDAEEPAFRQERSPREPRERDVREQREPRDARDPRREGRDRRERRREHRPGHVDDVRENRENRDARPRTDRSPRQARNQEGS